ncbi:hypothetical protein KXZ74_25890, partial [Escherichia coli]|nr:hypothetical protein [Escherichia coli]
GSGYAQHPLHRRKYSGRRVPIRQSLTSVKRLFSAIDETWQSLKDMVVGTLNTLYTAENIQDEEFQSGRV